MQLTLHQKKKQTTETASPHEKCAPIISTDTAPKEKPITTETAPPKEKPLTTETAPPKEKRTRNKASYAIDTAPGKKNYRDCSSSGETEK